MRILIVKMTSLGDVVHMLPALSEAAGRIAGLHADWVVEEGFAAVARLHPSVRRVIPAALRRWRHQLFKAATWREIAAFRKALRMEDYDLVLDSQGLIKSAMVACAAHGPRAGQDAGSAREPLASRTYQRCYPVPRNLHAITRNRLLAARSLGYVMGAEAAFGYGVSTPQPPAGLALPDGFVLALHGTARPEKEYPEADWMRLIAGVERPVLMPWGNPRERERAERLAGSSGYATVLPALDLLELAGVLGRAAAVVGVDTGLMHLAAAFRRPGVALYPSTPPVLYGVQPEPGAPDFINIADPAGLRPENAGNMLKKVLSGDLH